MGSRSRPHRVLSVCVCVCVSRCLWVCVIEANSLQLRVITIGLYQFLSRSPSCQILAVCGRRLRGVSGSWFPRFLSPAAFLDSDRRRLVCPLLPCATRLSPYGKLRFCLRKAPLLPTESSACLRKLRPCLRKAPFSFSLCITSCNKLSFSATESSRLHCDSLAIMIICPSISLNYDCILVQGNLHDKLLFEYVNKTSCIYFFIAELCEHSCCPCPVNSL